MKLLLAMLSLFVVLIHAEEAGGDIDRTPPVKRKPKPSKDDKDKKMKERKAKEVARDLKKKTKVAKTSGVIARYLAQKSEFIMENFDTFGNAKKFTISKKWEQKKNAKAKKDAKTAAQNQQIAKFKLEMANRGVDVPSDMYDGALDNVERKMWKFAKEYQNKEIKRYKAAKRKYGDDLKAYKKQLRKIKENNFSSFKKGKVFTRDMRDERKQQKKYDVNSSKWTEHENTWKELKRQRAEVLAKYESDKKSEPAPTKPTLYKVQWEPRARKAGKDHTGKGKADRVAKDMDDKDKKKEEDRRNRKKD